MSNKLAEFYNTYDLYDRSVEFIKWKHDQIHLCLSMFHCDDPLRADENKDYIMKLVFAADGVQELDGFIDDFKPGWYGEILQYDMVEQGIKIGISMSAKPVDKAHWLLLLLKEPPVSISETVEPIKPCLKPKTYK